MFDSNLIIELVSKNVCLLILVFGDFYFFQTDLYNTKLRIEWDLGIKNIIQNNKKWERENNRKRR